MSSTTDIQGLWFEAYNFALEASGWLTCCTKILHCAPYVAFRTECSPVPSEGRVAATASPSL